VFGGGGGTTAEGREGVVQMCAGSQAAALGIDFLKTESIANKA
jgi:hypothetical protein